MSNEEKAKILMEQEGLRKECELFAKNTSALISNFKVNFYASAIKKQCNDMIEKKSVVPFVMKLNIDNNLYLVPQNDKLCFVYGLNFTQSTDKSLVRVFLQELEDAKRHVKNSIEAKFYNETMKPPIELDGIESNPGRYNCGLVTMSKLIMYYNRYVFKELP